MSKPKFDPNKPFDVVSESKPKFDPNKPFEAVEASDSTSVKEEAPMEVSQNDARLAGFNSAVNLGAAPITAGAVEAASEGLSDIKDLVTGTERPDNRKGFQGLLDAYYEGRDKQKNIEAASFDQHPGSYLSSALATSIPMTALTGGLAGGVALNTGGKVAQLADAVNKSSTLAKGMAFGSGSGAVSGFSSGDAKLADGEFSKALEETSDTALGGLALGGLLPAGGKVLVDGAKKVAGGTKAVVNKVAPHLKTGYQLDQMRIGLNEKDITKANRSLGDEVVKELQSMFEKNGMDSKKAKKMADEIGIRVDAGEDFTKVMEELNRIPITDTLKSQKLPVLKDIKQIAAPDIVADEFASKSTNKLDMSRAKNVQKIQEKGGTLLDETLEETPVASIIDGTTSPDQILSANQSFQVPGKIGKDGAPTIKNVSKLIQQAKKILPEELATVDVENLTLKELDEVLEALEPHIGDWKSSPIGAQSVIRQLSGALRGKRDEALALAGQSNQAVRNLDTGYSALNHSGIDSKLLNSPREFNENSIKVQKMIKSGDPIRRNYFFEELKKVDPDNWTDIERRADILNEGNYMVGKVEDASGNILNPKGAGNVAKATAYTGVVASKVKDSALGRGAQKLYKTSNEIATAGTNEIDNWIQAITNSGDSSSQSWLGPLQKAAQSDDRKRSAIMFGLAQQPAFKQLAQSMGQSITDSLDTTGDKVEQQGKDVINRFGN